MPDYNSMQAQLGLQSAQGYSVNSLGIPTPSPAEAAQAAMMQSQAAASFMVSQQVQANMRSMNSQIMNPYTAQAFAGFAGQQGFQQGALPSPTMMTPPAMGIFRPLPPSPMPSISPMQQMPLIQTPFTSQPTSPFFNSIADYNYNFSQQRGLQYEAAAMAAPGGLAHAGTALAGGLLGSRLGQAIGGAKFGGPLGMITGLMATEGLGLGGMAQSAWGAVNPLENPAMFTQQMSGMSGGFIAGGANLSPTGRGFDPSGNRRLARRLDELGGSPDFRNLTGGAFNTQDLVRMTGQAGAQGLLDSSQGAEQIAGRMKDIARVVRTFMRTLEEPDMQEVLRNMGRLQSMGLSLKDMDLMAPKIKSYAKMAGASVAGILEAGSTGAFTFQQQGLTAGLGLQVGMHAMADARQSIAGGTYTPQQLALLGGQQGIAQRTMQTQAAMLQLPMMAAGMSTMGTGGTFGLNAGAVGALASGGVDYSRLAGMGAGSMASAVGRHGVGAIGMFQVQQAELQDQLGRALGPEGMKMLTFQQIMNNQKMLGLGGTPGGFASSAMTLGLDTNQTRQLMQEANSPEYWRNLQRQQEVRRMDIRRTAEERRLATEPGMLERAARQGLSRGGDLSAAGIYYGAERVGSGARDIVENVGNLFSEMGADSGGYGVTTRTHRSLLATGGQDRLLSRINPDVYSEFSKGVRERLGGASEEAGAFSIGGREYGRSRFVGGLQRAAGGNAQDLAQYREATSGVFGRTFLGGTAERVLRLGAAATFQDSGLVSPEEISRANTEMARSGRNLREGLAMGTGDRREATARLNQLFGGGGAGAAAAFRFRGRVEEELKNTIVGKQTWTGAAVSMGGEENEVIRAALKREGIDASKADIPELARLFIGRANEAAISETGQGIRLSEPIGVKEKKDFLAAVEKQQQSSALTFLGKSGKAPGLGEAGFKRGDWLSTGGSDSLSSRQERVMDALSGEQPEVVALAALKAAGRFQEMYDVLEEIPEKDRDALDARADSIVKLLEKEKDVLAGIANNLSTKKTAKDKVQEAGRGVGTWLAGKKMPMVLAGLQKLLRDPNLASKGMDIDTALEMAGANAVPSFRKLGEKYRKETNTEKKNKLRRQAEEQVLAAGGVSATEVGGGGTSADEAAIDKATEMSAATRAALASSFPAAVQTFSESITAFKEASNAIVKSMPSTDKTPAIGAFPPGYNPWIGA